MKKLNKKYCAKEYAIYSIQFYKNKSDTLSCLETANNQSLLENETLNLYMFGSKIAKGSLLNTKQKKAFSSFCQAFLDNYKGDKS